jgi:hypothetical protein
MIWLRVRYNRLVWQAVLGVDYQQPKLAHKVVLLSRKTAGYRRAHNEEQLAAAIREELKLEVHTLSVCLLVSSLIT